MNIPNRIKWIAIAAAIAVAAGGLWLSGRTAGVKAEHRSTAANATSNAANALAPRKVEVIKPERMTMYRSLDVPATIEAFETADLYARASGYIREVRVDIGDKVRAGDVLAVIDVPEMADELRQAEAVLGAKEATLAQARSMVQTVRAEIDRYDAELSLKKITFDRKKELRAASAIPEQELDQARGEHQVAEAQTKLGNAKAAGAEADVKVAEANVATARAAVARLRTLMDYAMIKAPFDGVVSRRLVDRGELVQATTSNRSTPMFTVERTDLLRIFIDVPETDVPYIQAGVAARVTPYGMKGLSFEGKVARIASSLNPNTRTMRTEIDLPNQEGRLMHGMYAQVELKLDEQPDALTVPATALLTEGPQAYVFTVKDDRAVRTNIRTGLDDGIRVEVKQGLDDDALVVLAGKGLVADGSPVRPVLKDSTS
jgi:RND family efflux transporter MFP subunit